MKRTVSLLLALLILIPVLAGCTPEVPAETPAAVDGGAEEEAKVPGVFMNIDINSTVFPFLENITSSGAVSEASLYSFVDQHMGSQVTDIAFNIFCQISATPSEVFTTITDKYLQTEENGLTVDYKEDFQQNYDIFEKYDIDCYKVWIDRCYEKGFTPWISVRMNDRHGAGQKTYFLHSDFYYEAEKNGWFIGKEYGMYRTCFDYAHEEVREKMLAYIEEQVMRYGTNLELDFSREWYIFDYRDNPGCHEIMTEFLREVKKIVEKAEKHWDREIKILIRMMRDIEQNKIFGLDAEAIAAEGLADIFCISPRYTSNDSDMPVEEWKERFPGMEIYAGIEKLTLDQPSDLAVLSGFAAQYLSRGADKIYLYNLFVQPFFLNVLHLDVMNTCGDLATLQKADLRYVVAEQDTYPHGSSYFHPFPHTVRDFSIDLHTAPIPADAEVELILGLSVNWEIGAEDVVVTVNGTPCTFAGEAKIKGSQHAPDGVKLFSYTVPADCSGTVQHVALSGEKDAYLVQYMELSVRVP